MSPSQAPLTLQEIDDFLVGLDKRRCPWCDGHHWGLHIDAAADAPTPPQPGLRSLPRIRLAHSDSGTLSGSIAMGTEGSLMVIVVECQACGYIYLFNYFAIMKKVRAMAAGKTDGNDSPN